MKSEESQLTDKDIDPLARYLAAAYIGYQMGVRPETARKWQADGKPIGEYWYRLAKRVWCEMADAMERRAKDDMRAIEGLGVSPKQIQ